VEVEGDGESAIYVACWVVDEVAKKGTGGAVNPRRPTASMQRKKRTWSRRTGDVDIGKKGMREPRRPTTST
jgi:hypothetical protein